MLTHQQQRQAASASSNVMEKPSIGSLFVPTRMQQPRSEAITTARIALPGLRQPSSAADDLGLIMAPQYNTPTVAAGERNSQRSANQMVSGELPGFEVLVWTRRCWRWLHLQLLLVLQQQYNHPVH
jgi:hypothetical protein